MASNSIHVRTPVNAPDTQVAEVVASYARSVLDVAHVGQARSRRNSSIPLMAFGGALMLGGLGLFGYEVAQPWQEYTSAVAEAQKLHAEAPPAPGLGTGALGMMLALLGLVPFVAGGMRRRDIGLEAYLIGEGDEARLKVNGAGLADPAASALVSRESDGYALAFTAAMNGSVELGGESISLADLVTSGRAQATGGAWRYFLPDGAKAHVMHGDVRFDVSVVNRGSAVAGRGEIDWPFWSYFSGTATVGTAFYLLMRSMPADALTMEMAEAEASARFVSFFHQADETDVVEPVEVDHQPIGEQTQSSNTEERATGPVGRSNDRKPGPTGGAGKNKGPRNSDPSMNRYFDLEDDARHGGILGALPSDYHRFMANSDAFTLGIDDTNVWTTIHGVEHAGSYETQLKGTPRFGGKADGAVDMDASKLTGCCGDGDRPTRGKTTGFGEHKAKVPVARGEKPIVDGDIDREVIRRVVRAHLNEVRHCYNTALLRNPNLEGRVTVQFAILPTGKVASSIVRSNETDDSKVAECIAKSVSRWTFPRGGNSGMAVITYPFLLTGQ